MQTHTLWYIQKDGEVRGPYPRTVIAQYLLLNRLRKEDQVSTDQEHWQAIADVKELVPAAVKGTLSGAVNQYLADVAARDDEHIPTSKQNTDDVTNQYLLDVAKRNARALNGIEPEDVVEYHRNRSKTSSSEQKKKPLTIVLAVTAILATVGALVVLVMNYTPQANGPEAECSAAPAANVNWSNCSLQGAVLDNSNLQQAVMRNANLTGSTLQRSDLQNADLAYANLSLVNLGQANLRGAQLMGAKLNGSDLSGADLSGADLSYADLSGANIKGVNLAGAKLDQTLWLDKTICARGSVGQCLAGR